MAGIETDRQTKSSRWAFTAYEDQWSLFETMPPGIAEWGWNAEICPKTNRRHYQGYLRLTQQQRFAWLRKLLPGVHIEVSKNWEALKQYCQKEETRIPGTEPVARSNSVPSHFQYADDCGKRIYEHATARSIELTRENILIMLETIVSNDIASGKRYAAWITTNPMWKVMWQKWAPQFILSFNSINDGPSST